MKNIKIKNKYIGSKYPPFIIAEISANHKKSLNRIYKIINAASKAGFDAIKVQTYKPETITMKLNSDDFKIIDKKSLWNNKTLYEIYKKGSLPWEWHDKISKFCTKKKNYFF
jgi:sialic acid synthase SpsE